MFMYVHNHEHSFFRKKSTRNNFISSIVAAPSFSRWSRYRPSINDIVNYTHFRLSPSWLLTNISLCVPAVRHNEQEMKKCRTAFSRVKWLRRTSIVDNWIPFFGRGGNICAASGHFHQSNCLQAHHVHALTTFFIENGSSNVFLVCVCHEHPRGTFDRNFLVVAKFFFYLLAFFLVKHKPLLD